MSTLIINSFVSIMSPVRKKSTCIEKTSGMIKLSSEPDLHKGEGKCEGQKSDRDAWRSRSYHNHVSMLLTREG